MSSFYKDIREIVDPKSVHTEEQIVAIVEEKFTSTNTGSPKLLALFNRLCNYKYHGGDPEFVRVCNEIREQLQASA